jgi:phosphoribosylformylglycinamidine cyclo-ligase
MDKKLTYARTGVSSEEAENNLAYLLNWTNKTHAFRQKIGKIELNMGYFANVIDVGCNIGIALSTDGVGTKALVAQLMDKYDTIGIDCIAMNVNDIICVGADPITMLDYIALQKPEKRLLEEIGKGLYKGAEISNITISGGEISQIKEIIKGKKKNFGFDLVGMGVGFVPLDKTILGHDIEENDVIIGLKSTGVHCNGLTLARKALLSKRNYKIDDYVEELGRTIGEELLEPTHIYVPEIREMMSSGLKIKALVNITSFGFLNLKRIERPFGYIINKLPSPQPVFNLIQSCGNITTQEMYNIFNMGIGFCVIVLPEDADKIIKIAKKHSVEAFEIGYIVKDEEKKVRIEPEKIVGKKNKFYKYS